MIKPGKRYLILPFVLVCLNLPDATANLEIEYARTREESIMTKENAEAGVHDPQRDFDFIIGSWKVHNRRLKQRLKGSNSWEEFESTIVARKIWGGTGNVDEYEADSPSGRIQGMTVRLYNPKSQQ
jgi:hypothetical protein